MREILKVPYRNYEIILKHLGKRNPIEEVEKFWIIPQKGKF